MNHASKISLKTQEIQWQHELSKLTLSSTLLFQLQKSTNPQCRECDYSKLLCQDIVITGPHMALN